MEYSGSPESLRTYWPGPSLRAITVPSMGALMVMSGLMSRSRSTRATSSSLRPTSTRRRLRAAVSVPSAVRRSVSAEA